MRNKKMKKLLLFVLLLVLPFAMATDMSLEAEVETGLTIVTGTVVADSVAGLPITVVCVDATSFVLGTAVSNEQGLFSVVYDNTEAVNTCYEGAVVKASIDNTEYASRYVTVETAGPYDYANADIKVPEFGVLAAFGIIGLAGLFIYNKRD
jgi:hypothetical protein